MKYELNVLKVMSLLSPALKVMAHVCNMFTVLHFESLVARLLISCCAMVIWYTLMHGNDPSAWITWYMKTDIKEESRGWFFPYSFAMGIPETACMWKLKCTLFAVNHLQTNQILFLQNSMYTKLCSQAVENLVLLLLYVKI